MSQKNIIDLTDATFIIPLRVDSSDRLRNIITSLCYICSHFVTTIFIKEVSSEPTFGKSGLPQIHEFCDADWNLGHLGISYEHIKDDSPIFHRQKIINEMLDKVQTEITINYDADILLPLTSYEKAINMLLEKKADIVYPYGQGEYQKQVFANDHLVTEFLTNDFDFRILDSKSKNYDAQFGFVQFFNTEVYLEGGGENENFVAYAPEDIERHHRFKTLGYDIKRINDWVYHLEHVRTPNSWFNNPYMEKNSLEWQKVALMTKEELQEYTKSSNFIK